MRTDGRFLKEANITDEVLDKIKCLNAIAESRGQTLAQMSLSWVYRLNEVTSVLIGASKPEQILDNIGMLKNTNFTDDELKAIENAIK